MKLHETRLSTSSINFFYKLKTLVMKKRKFAYNKLHLSTQISRKLDRQILYKKTNTKKAK